MQHKLPIEVITRNIANPDLPPSIKQIDYRNASDRKWLANHCYWAFNNQHSVTTSPILN